MTRKQRRLVLIGSALAVLVLAVGLVLTALKDSIVFFNSPTDVVEKQIAPGARIRLGGLVKEGSVARGDNLQVRFAVTDGRNTIPVAYQGLLPDLFREGQGVVTEGALDQAGTFKADSVLAKHDENYMPREVADRLKQQGHWKDDTGKKTGTPGRGSRSDPRNRPLRAGARLRARHRAGLRAALRRAAQRSGADGDRRCRPRWRSSSSSAISFAALTAAYVGSDFSVVNVFENSHSLKPLIYKISGVWGNHEGSMLLWVLILALFGALVALFGGNLPAHAQGQCAGGAVVDRGRLHPVHPGDLEPVPAAGAGAARKAATSIRCCRIPASRSIRRCFTSAMSGSRSRSRSRSRR